MIRPIQVLLVEDHPGNARLFREMLAGPSMTGLKVDASFEVTDAGCLQDALARAAHGGMDIILLDLLLPDSEGLPTFLKIQAVARNVPIIVLTSLEDEALALRALQSGAQDYLFKKEVNSRHLARSIRYAVERTRIERSLRESEERLRSIIETSPDAIVMTDLEPRIVLSNRVAAAMAGYASPADMVGLNAFDLIAPEDHGEAMEGMQITLQAGVVRNREYRLIRKDGTRYPAELDASLIRDEAGRPVAFTAVIKDITARRILEERRRKYEFIANTAPILLTLVNRAFVYEAANDAYCIAHGWKRESVVGRSVEEVWGKDIFQSTLKHYFDTCFRGQEVEYEAWFTFAALGNRFFRVSYHPYFNPAGDVTHAVVVCDDITEREQSQEALAAAHLQLKRANDELEERVQVRTAALTRANADLETLLHVISHDLKEPLRAIENFSHLLVERCGEQISERGQDFLRRIINAGTRLHRLMDDILRLSRARRLESPLEDVEGVRVVHEAIARLDARIRESRAKVEIVGVLPNLRVEKGWATEAVYNLLDNALKFTRNGEPPAIEIAPFLDPAGESVSVGLVVRDRGPGIPADQRDRIFQLFQRGVGREVEGTGAGLAIVRQIAERHGGSVWVEPRVGGGSDFVITFGPTVDEMPSVRLGGLNAAKGRPGGRGMEIKGAAAPGRYP